MSSIVCFAVPLGIALFADHLGFNGWKWLLGNIIVIVVSYFYTSAAGGDMTPAVVFGGVVSFFLLIMYKPKKIESSVPTMKICKFCAEEIKITAVLCKHCKKECPNEESQSSLPTPTV